MFQNSAYNLVAAWLMDRATIAASGAIANADAPPGRHVQSDQDVNGDGRADLIFRNEYKRSVAEWQMSGIAAQSTALLTIVPGAQWDLIG